MRLLSHAVDGEDRVAVVVGPDRALDVKVLLRDGPWSMSRLIAEAPGSLERLREAHDSIGAEAGSPISSLRLLPPVVRPSKIIAIGRNYREHAAEESAALPEAPLIFAKLPSALVADGAAISWSSSLTTEVDYEAELAVVIGRRARDVPEEDALAHVFGYTCLNDVSARDVQFGDGQWTRGKGLDTFCPMGPWLATTDVLTDPGDLHVRCRVNGELRQDASTKDLVHGVAELIAYCSRSFTLEPGDVIATGTPGGVGAFREPPVFLADGDVVEVEIDRIGVLRNHCRVLP